MTAALLFILAAPASAAPETGFEQTDGASWTTHEQELAFLAAVDQASERARVDVVGRTAQGRPLHLVRLGADRPRSAKRARKEPTLLYVCSQHGNEPAGREACLSLLRDLALTDDPSLVDLLERATVLFVPTANPDGRAANTRGNSRGTDINRDHLNLVTEEARAMAGVVRTYKPEMVLDLHEYGPSQPVLYDDDVLLLWPRNLNADAAVHDESVDLVERLGAAVEAGGYSWDEYGQQKVGDYHVTQTAGDGDEGIARNAMGLRHSLGVLAETRVDADPTNSLTEAVDAAEVNRRRVASHSIVAREALGYLDDSGAHAAAITAAAATAKAREGAARDQPVYFGGADNAEPAEEDVVFPPPCGYSLTAAQYDTVADALALLGVKTSVARNGSAFVGMAQAAEPLIPLLLDGRGTRHSVEATPLDSC